MQMLPPETAECSWRSLAAGLRPQGLSCPDAVGRVLLFPIVHLRGPSSQSFLPFLYITGYSFPLQLSLPQPFPFPATVSPTHFSAWSSLHRHPKTLVLPGQRETELVSGGSTRAGHVPWSRGEWPWCAAVPVTQGQDKQFPGRICWLMGCWACFHGHLRLCVTNQRLCLAILSRWDKSIREIELSGNLVLDFGE